MAEKPAVKLVGVDSNIFTLVGLATRALKRAGLQAEANKMTEEVFNAESYDQALSIIMKYVDAE
jgi:hypothetical protein